MAQTQGTQEHKGGDNMPETEHAKEQAQAQLESIKEMVEALSADSDEDNEEAAQAIQEDPLEIAVRSDWHAPGEDSVPTEYMILLCTGGPAARIVGDLSRYQEPDSARLEYQDWFTPWMDYPLSRDEEATVLTYAQQFYFGI